MQKFSIGDGGTATGQAKDRVGLVAGTTYFAKYWNDNFFNIFNAVENAGYSLIDDDLEQLTKAMKGKYVATYTYNTSGIATQTVDDVVLGSDGKYYEAQEDSISGDDPVGSVTGDWAEFIFDEGAKSLLAEFEVTSAAVQTIDFSGLDIGTHKSYRIEIDIINAVASSANISLYANGDTVSTNYWRQIISVSGAGTSGIRNQDAIISNVAASSKGKIVGNVSLNDSIVMGTFQAATDIDANIQLRNTVFNKIATITNLTSLTISSSVAASLGIGTKVRIYRGDV